MSTWMYLAKFPPDIKAFSELPETFWPPVICTKAEFIAFLLEIDPAADFSEVGVSKAPWIRVSTDDGDGMEVPMPGDPVDRIALRSPSPMLIKLLCDRFKCRVWNTSSGMIEEPDELFR
jgi:hypothetical protein